MSSDYLALILNNGVMLNQIEAYSDKVRIAKGAWNLREVPLHQRSVNTDRENAPSLRTLAYEQHASYYLGVEQSICKTMSGVLNTQLNTIDDVALALEKIGSEDKLQKLIVAY